MLSHRMAIRKNYRTMLHAQVGIPLLCISADLMIVVSDRSFNNSLTGDIEMNSFPRLQQSVMKRTTSQVTSFQ